MFYFQKSPKLINNNVINRNEYTMFYQLQKNIFFEIINLFIFSIMFFPDTLQHGF